MIAARLPEEEMDRLQELYRYELLDTVYENEFDAIVQLASRICKTPMSVITLIDRSRSWFKAKLGLDDEQADRNVAFCAHTILGDKLLEVENATDDERFWDNPFVTGDPYIRYYAGMPLVTKAGYKLGTLCVLDSAPRQLDNEQKFALKVLSEQVVKLFELRLLNKEVKKVNNTQQKIMAIMAHDIRGPLTALKTTYEMKNEGDISDAEMKELDQFVPKQLQHTVDLLDNIVGWGKVRLSDGSNRSVSFNAHELCEECLGLLTLPANSKNNTLINETEPSLRVNWFPDTMRFILRNLLGNANKFTDNGLITVKAEIANDTLNLFVSDTGIGIAPERQKALSDQNWLNTTIGTNQETGSGLGLKMIYESLAELKGTIRFGNNTPKGTIVNISIPLFPKQF
jgi:K+-sensing histidine kinase KdpD